MNGDGDKSSDKFEKFDWLVGWVLSELVSSFPVGKPIYFLPDIPEPFDDVGEYMTYLRETVDWLAREGVIQIIREKHFRDQHVTVAINPAHRGNVFRLSAKGLMALDMNVGPQGVTVREAVKDKSGYEAIGATLSHWLGKFAGGFVDSLS